MFQLAILTSLMLAAAVAVPSQGKATYAVVVNEKNACKDTGDKAKSTVKKLFLKELSKWPNGDAAKPYGRKKGEAFDAFRKDVLGMDDAELARHWLKMKNLNGTTPPKDVRSGRMVLKYVAKYEGALGIVKIEDAEKAKGVKILCRF
ncbi:MAG: hypothetical protein ACE37K_14595 [Planctomycetota bacterium]